MLVTRGLGANGVLPTAGMGYDSYASVVSTVIVFGGGSGTQDEVTIKRRKNLKAVKQPERIKYNIERDDMELAGIALMLINARVI